MIVMAALLATGFVAVGCALLYWGLKTLILRLRRRKYMLITTGTVLTSEMKRAITSSSGPGEQNDLRMKVYNFPIIEFMTDRGEKRTFKSTVGIPADGESNMNPGSKVEIVYDRENPEDAFLNDRFSWYGFALSLFIAGVIGTSAGFIVFLLFVF